MIHRFLVRGVAVTLPVMGVLLAAPVHACRTTTCAVTPVPEGCQRDPVSGCWAAGAPLFWEQGCLSYTVMRYGARRLGFDYVTTEALVTRAFAQWLTTSCGESFPSIALLSMGPGLCDRREYNPSGPNSNAVLFIESDWDHDPGALGLTTVSFHPDTGKIFDADIEVNVAGFELSELALEYVVTHEAGHFLGLDHSPDPTAVMYLRYSPFGVSTPPALTPDDSAWICETYPPRATPVCDFEPERGFSADCGGNIEGGCALSAPAPRSRVSGALLACFLSFFVTRRRARHLR